MVTQGSRTTVYTVPASKAARVRILFAMEGGATTDGYAIAVGAPGTDWHISRLLSGNDDVFSGMSGAADKASNLVGLVDGAAVLDISATDSDKIIVPFPHDFFLSTGDVVDFQIRTNDAVDHLIQVIGVEDDA